MLEPRFEKELSTIREWMLKLECLNDADAVGARVRLNESQESKSIAAAKKLAMQKLKYNEEEATQFIEELRQDVSILSEKGAAKFTFGVARMYCDGQLKDARTRHRLNNTLKYVASDAHINEYDRDLNGMSPQDLIQRFARALDVNLEKDKAEVSRQRYEANGQYSVVRIDSFGQAQRYGGYTTWCITHYRDMFNKYSSGGFAQFYFCLRKGLENVEKNMGEGCPLDEYGLSMLAVCVDERGALATCTCRWNHENGGNDHILNTKEISQLIGQNFYDVFKPNNNWQEVVDKALARVKNGERLENVFVDVSDFGNGIKVCKLMRKYNFFDRDLNLLFPDVWFDSVDYVSKGFARVTKNEKVNVVDENGAILYQPNNLDEWFDYVGSFDYGPMIVCKNNKWNFINKEGAILYQPNNPDEWFSMAHNVFKDGFAIVGKGNKYNFINAEGVILYQPNNPDEWFDNVENFQKGLAVVKKGQKYNVINTKGALLYQPNNLDEWLDYACAGDGPAQIGKNERYNFIDAKGSLLFKSAWLDGACPFRNGFAVIRNGAKYNFITRKGSVLYQPNNPDEWFDDARDFCNGFAAVQKGAKYNFITKKGAVLYQPNNPAEWFDGVEDFLGKFALVKKGKYWFRLRKDGVLCDDCTKEPVREAYESARTKLFPHSRLLSESRLHRIIVSEIARLL